MALNLPSLDAAVHTLRPNAKPVKRKTLKGRKDRAEADVIKCAKCGMHYERPIYRRLSKFCSPRCYKAVQAERREAKTVRVPCAAKCGASVVRYRKYIESHHFIFCSQECSRKHQVADKSATWRGGAIQGRGSMWAHISEAIRTRDNHACRWCGKSQAENKRKLSVDHVRPWREFESQEEANDPINLVSLCQACHGKKQHLEGRWLQGDGLALQEYRRYVGIESGAPDKPLTDDHLFRLGPPRKPVDQVQRGKAISAGKKRYYANPEIKEKWKAINQKKAQSPQWRAKVSAAAKAQWARPGMRERMCRAMREARQ